MKSKIESIQIVHVLDDAPDTSTIGKFTDSPDDWAIVREGEYSGQYIANLPEDAELPDKGREYRFFKPYAGGEKEGTAEYQTYGLQDWDRMEKLNNGDYCFIGAFAEAEVLIQVQQAPAVYRSETFRSSGLWGIESDSKDYLKEVADEQIAELKGYLKTLKINIRQFDKQAAEAKDKDAVFSYR